MNTTENFIIEKGVLSHYHGKAEEKITIPDGVTTIANDVFRHCETLKEVILPDGVRRIGHGAFYGCRALTHVHLPEGLEEIGNVAFAECVRMEHIHLPMTVRALGEGAFYECKALREIVLPDGLKRVEGEVFNRCSALQHVTFPTGLMHIEGWAFIRCESLTEVVLSDGLLSIGEGAFHSCKAMTQITLPDSLQSIDAFAFHSCASLREIVIPDSVRHMGNALFNGCKQLSRVVMPQMDDLPSWTCWNCPGLANNQGFVIVNDILFDYYGRQKKVTVPDGVKRIDRDAFYHRRTVETICLPDSVTFIANNAFAGPKELTLRFNGNADTETGAFNGVQKMETPNLSLAAFHSSKEKRMGIRQWFMDGVQHPDRAVWPEYAKYAFSQRKRLLLMAFAEDWVAVPAFYAAQGKITVSNFESDYLNPAAEANASECIAFLMDWKAQHISAEATVRYEERKFEREMMKDPYNAADMRKLWEYTSREDGTVVIIAYKGKETDVVVPPYIGRRNVTAIGDYAFALSDLQGRPRSVERQNVLQRIRTVTLGEHVTRIGIGAFMGCTSLTQITLPPSLQVIGPDAFSVCQSLKQLELPENLHVLGGGACRGCHSLQHVTLPANLKEIHPMTFSGCWKLEEVLLPEALEILDERAFADCKNLVRADFGPALKSIGRSAFAGCSQLAEVLLQDGVTEIGPSAFSNCTNLRRLTLPASIKEVGACMLNGCTAVTHLTTPVVRKKMGANLIGSCTRLEQLTILPGVNQISKDMFRGAWMTEVILPEGIVQIDDFAFMECGRLQSIRIPSTVEVMGNSVFEECPQLKDVYFSGKVPLMRSTTFRNCTKITIHVAEMSTMLRVASRWGNIRIQLEPDAPHNE